MQTAASSCSGDCARPEQRELPVFLSEQLRDAAKVPDGDGLGVAALVVGILSTTCPRGGECSLSFDETAAEAALQRGGATADAAHARRDSRGPPR